MIVSISQTPRPNPTALATHLVRRSLRTAASASAGFALFMAASASSTASEPSATAARSIDSRATAHLHLVRAEGGQLLEEGPVSGSLAGTMRASLETGHVFTGSFTTRVHGGSINGHGAAKPHGAGRYQSFSGYFVATGGTGRYAHIKGRAGLYGVFDRRTDSVVVQTTGRLSY